MQTFQLLKVGVGTVITLGVSSSAVWGNPSALASHPHRGIPHGGTPQWQPSDVRSLAIGQPTPIAPTTLGSVQFLTATQLTAVNRPTALIVPFLNQALPSFEGAVSQPGFPTQLGLPTIDHSLTLAAIAAEAATLASPVADVDASAHPPAVEATPAKAAIPQVNTPALAPSPPIEAGDQPVGGQAEVVVNLQAPQVDVKAEVVEPEDATVDTQAVVPATISVEVAAPIVDGDSHPEVLEADTVDAVNDAVDASPELEAAVLTEPATARSTRPSFSVQRKALTPQSDANPAALTVTVANAVEAPAAGERETVDESGATEAGVAVDGVEEPIVPVAEAAGETEAAPAIAATHEATEAGDTAVSEEANAGEASAHVIDDATDDATPDLEATTPTHAPTQIAEAAPTPVPQTELPEARELQERQTDDRAEAIQPKAVSVNEPMDSQGPLPELNPNPNLLYLPDKPEEVQIQLTQPINLRQAVEQALSNNLTLRDNQLRLDRSLAQLREAQAAWHPTVNLQSVLQRVDSSSAERTNRIRARNANPLNNLLGTADTVNRALTGRIGIDWAVFTSGRRMANIRAARQQVRISELEVKRQTDAIILDVSNSYFDLQETDAQVRIAEAAVNSAQQSLRDAQLQFDAGVGTRFDVLQAEVQLANQKQNLTNRLAQQQIARRQLSQQLNVPQTVNLVASSRVEVAGTWKIPLEETIIQAYENRPGLEQRLAERELRRQQRRAELAATLPQIGAFADYDVLKNLDDGIGLTDGNTVGVRLDWRLYDGGAARARARQRSIEAEIAEVGFSDIRNQIRFEVERAYSNLLSNFENIDTARVAVNQAEEALRLARLRFQAGVGTQTDVINSETDLTNARGNLLQAVINYNRSLATLERAVSLPIAESQTINNEGRGTPINGGGSGS